MKSFKELVINDWYAPIFNNQVGSFYQYLGGFDFVTENGELAEYFYDPEIGLGVSVDAADGYTS
jgi:hypothetical protein